MLIILNFILGIVAVSAILCARHRRWGYTQSLLKRSCCDHCTKLLSWTELIPIMGWSLNFGRCSWCRHLISLTYPVTELMGGLWAVAMFNYQLINPLSPMVICIFITTGIIFAFIIDDDINHYRIRDHHTFIVAMAGVMLEGQYLTTVLMGGLLTLTTLIYRRWRGHDGLGYGDIKLVYALGLWLPITAISSYFIGIGIIGILWGTLWHHHQRSRIFPYGPVLIISFIGLYVFGLARFTNCGILKEIIVCTQGSIW